MRPCGDHVSFFTLGETASICPAFAVYGLCVGGPSASGYARWGIVLVRYKAGAGLTGLHVGVELL